jgi:hypothetical protein
VFKAEAISLVTVFAAGSVLELLARPKSATDFWISVIWRLRGVDDYI